MKSAILLVATALLALPQLAKAGIDHETIHLLAKQSTVLSTHGVDVPKVYVLASNGDLVFEGAASKDQRFEPILKSIRAGAKTGGKKDTPIYKLLRQAGFKPARGGKPVVVTLEVGSSIGECPSCSPFYPELTGYLVSNKADFHWIHLVFEKNDYRATK